MLWTNELTGSPTWTEQPLTVVKVSGRLIVIDGNHRLQAALNIGYKGDIPFNTISVEQSGYSLRELLMFIR